MAALWRFAGSLGPYGFDGIRGIVAVEPLRRRAGLVGRAGLHAREPRDPPDGDQQRDAGGRAGGDDPPGVGRRHLDGEEVAQRLDLQPEREGEGERRHHAPDPRPHAPPLHAALDLDDDAQADRRRHHHGGAATLDDREVERPAHQQVGGRDGRRRDQARRHGERGQRAQEALAAHRPRALGQREEERRDPDRERRRHAEVARQEREGDRREPEGRQQHGRVDRLRHEQLRDAVGVADDAPALLDRRRDGGELVGQQHQVADALGHLAAVAHGDRQARLLQGEHVVDAVAAHRHVAAAAGEAGDQALLLLGRHPPEDRGAQRHVGQRLVVVRDVRAGQGGPGAGDAGRQRDGLHRLHAVAADDLEVDALGGEERHRPDRLLAQPLDQQGDADRREPAGQVLARQRLRGAGQQHHPAALARVALDGVAQRVGQDHAGAGEHVGGAEHQRARAVELHGAPLARGRERHLGGDGPRLGGEALGDRLAGAVARARARRQRPQQLAGLVLLVARRRLDALEPDAVVGERAGLVEAARVHARQALDRVQALGERAQPPQPHGRDGEGQARQQHQALGHQRHQGGDGRVDRVGDAAVLELPGPPPARSPAAPSPRP